MRARDSPFVRLDARNGAANDDAHFLTCLCNDEGAVAVPTPDGVSAVLDAFAGLRSLTAGCLEQT